MIRKCSALAVAMTLAFSVTAAAQSADNMTVLDKMAKIETMLYGNEQTGALVDRAAQVEQDDGARHQPKKLRLPPAVEQEAEEQQHGILKLTGHQEIYRHHSRQEIKQKRDAGEYHYIPLLLKKAAIAQEQWQPVF